MDLQRQLQTATLWLCTVAIITFIITFQPITKTTVTVDDCIQTAILKRSGYINICHNVIELVILTNKGKFRNVKIIKEDSPTIGHPVLTTGDDEFVTVWSNNMQLKIKPENIKTNAAYRLLWSAARYENDITLTIDLGQANWYGGGETSTQAWPIQTQDIHETPFVTNGEIGAVLARYFLSSDGLAHYVDATTPLFVNLTSSTKELTFRASYESPYRNTDGRQLTLDHVLIVGEDLLDAHKNSLENYLGYPKSVPDEDIFRRPIWSTWVSYKKRISQRQVLDFANQISSHGFPASQIEIDNNWEICYGDETFIQLKFPDPQNMTNEIHAMGHNVTLWVHPFVNLDCVDTFKDGDERKAFVTSDGYNITGITSWWDGEYSGVIDITKVVGATWWRERLNNLRVSTGVDSFKFDAGESSYLPANAYMNCSQDLHPACYSTMFAEFAASFGGRIECRAGYLSQTVPAFIRMNDRQSSWGLDGGMQSVITTSLFIGLLGYPFVLPDMIGGNAYGTIIPFDELFVRWAQLNAFLPAMQFSIAPWSYNANVSEIALNMVELHQNIVDDIIAAATQATVDGSPIIRPLWWVDPNDVTAQVTNDQFMVGEKYLVAPIVKEGTLSRNIYLPIGTWQEAMNSNTIYIGPILLTDYNVPIDKIAYFIKVT